MLAFKNDIQFWKTKDNLKGLSIRAVLFNCFCQLIVLLYICDNDTNTMVSILQMGWNKATAVSDNISFSRKNLNETYEVDL